MTEVGDHCISELISKSKLSQSIQNDPFIKGDRGGGGGGGGGG